MVFVGMYRRIRPFQGFLGGAKWISQPSHGYDRRAPSCRRRSPRRCCRWYSARRSAGNGPTCPAWALGAAGQVAAAPRASGPPKGERTRGMVGGQPTWLCVKIQIGWPPVNIRFNPTTKIGSKMGGAPIPKWDHEF